MPHFFADYIKLLDTHLKWWLGQTCVYCEAYSSMQLCASCSQLLTPIGTHCQTCAREVADAQTTCGQCLQTPHAIGKMYVAYRYRSPVREIVLKAKYGRDRGALDVLQQFILDACPAHIAADLIVPMPISKRRLARRGFNQTHTLANAISTFYKIPQNKGALVKQSRRAQSTLRHDASRRANIKGAFSARAALQGHVILVDDVVTSGATAKEAAATLKAAGAAFVSLIAVAAR